MKIYSLYACLLITAFAYAAPIYTDTGSASTACYSISQFSGPEIITASGAIINLQCPTGMQGAGITGYATQLATGANVGRPWIPGPVAVLPNFTFSSSMSDSITASTSEIARFTITYNWTNIGDDGQGTTSGDFFFNGQLLWERSDLTCLFGQPCWDQDAFHHVVTMVFDETLSPGVQYSYQADVNTLDDGQFVDSLSNTVTVSVGVPVPEPSIAGLTAIGLFFLALRRYLCYK